MEIIKNGVVVTEKSGTATQDDYGRSTLSFTTIRTYQAIIEPIKQSIALDESGYLKSATHRMYSISEPTLGNYIEYDSNRYLIQEVNPIHLVNSREGYYEAGLRWQNQI